MSIYTVAVITCALVIVSGCSCASSRQAEESLRASEEEWRLVGEYITPREKEGPPKENYIGTVQLPEGELVRLVDFPIKTPDGQDVGAIISYNASRNVMVCVTSGREFTDDVWRHDLATGQSRWIAKGKWNQTRGFAWSPDGSKVAFVASTRGDPAAFVMEYDLDGDHLEKVAGDAFGNRDDQQEGDSSIRPRRPAYSEDGKSLYFVSMDQNVMRVDLRTRQLRKLSFGHAICVLTVIDEHLVYAREIGNRKDWRFEIVKVRLDIPDGQAGEKVLHAGRGVIWGNYVSPSRRFVLLTSRMGYGSDTRLLDVNKENVHRGGSLLGPEGFSPQSSVYVSETPSP